MKMNQTIQNSITITIVANKRSTVSCSISALIAWQAAALSQVSSVKTDQAASL